MKTENPDLDKYDIFNPLGALYDNHQDIQDVLSCFNGWRRLGGIRQYGEEMDRAIKYRFKYDHSLLKFLTLNKN